MINSVSSLNKPFDMVTKSNRIDSYWLSGENKKDEIGDILDLKNVNDVTRKGINKIKAICLSIGGAIVLSAGTIFFILKGGPSAFSKIFEKINRYRLKRLQISKLNGEKINENTKFVESKLINYLSKIEAGNNITTMKDYAIKRLMYAISPTTRKIHQAITKFFERIGRQTVVDAYNSTGKKFKNINILNDKYIKKLLESGDLDKQITINGQTMTKNDWLNKIKSNFENINNSYTYHFGKSRRDARYLKMHNSARELEEFFNQSGHFWFLSRDTFKKFVAEQKMLKGKMHIKTPIKTVRRQLTFTSADLLNEANEKIMKISAQINYKDKDTLLALNNVRNNIKNYLSGSNNVSKDSVILDMDKFIDLFKKSINPKDIDKISTLDEIIELKTTLKNYNPGKIEEILDIYKTFTSKNEYSKIKNSYRKAVKSLDKSINLETEEFVNKLRDLTMGSAPTDIITVATGVGTLGYYLAKAKDNNERVGITFKYGIPALTLIATCLYGNAKLFAGSKSMALGIISSWLVNRIGNYANDKYQKHVVISQNQEINN